MKRKDLFLSRFGKLKTQAHLWLKDGEIELVIKQESPDSGELETVALDHEQIKDLIDAVLDELVNALAPTDN